MSADDFDPAIERLFARPPHFPDSALFEADVAARLTRTSRIRTLALSAAGLVGGLFAVREVVGLNLDFSASEAAIQGGVSGGRGSEGFEIGGLDMVATAHSVLEKGGLQDLALGSLGGVQLFWITAGALVALLAAGAMRLSQEI